MLLALVSVAIILWTFRMNALEHRVFRTQLNARADFELSFRLVGWPDDVVELGDPSSGFARLGIGLKNTGDKAAGHTLINVIGPDRLAPFEWCSEDGSSAPEPTKRGTTPERLDDAEGESLPCQFITKELDRVSLRPHYEFFVLFHIAKGGSVPFRVTVQSDDLPENTDEVSKPYLAHGR